VFCLIVVLDIILLTGYKLSEVFILIFDKFNSNFILKCLLFKFNCFILSNNIVFFDFGLVIIVCILFISL